MDKAVKNIIILLFLCSGLPAYAGYCSTEDLMYEYKNNNEYINDPRSPLWGKGYRNPEYKPKLTEWIEQSRKYKAVINAMNESRCNNGKIIGSIYDAVFINTYTCGSIKINHKQTGIGAASRAPLTISYYLTDKNNKEFPLKYNILDTNDEICRCIYGSTDTTRTTICTQKLYNEYVNIDFINEITETQITKPRPQI
jgi:hypothetical protein